MVPQKSLDDIDKLLEIASQPKKRKVKQIKPNPEIDSFVLESKIEVGKKRIPTSIIYYRYFLWKKIRLVPRKKFIAYLQTKFEKCKTDHGIGFLLSSKEFDLTPQGFFRARAFLRKEQDERKKEKQQKKQS